MLITTSAVHRCVLFREQTVRRCLKAILNSARLPQLITLLKGVFCMAVCKNPDVKVILDHQICSTIDYLVCFLHTRREWSIYLDYPQWLIVGYVFVNNTNYDSTTLCVPNFFQNQGCNSWNSLDLWAGAICCCDMLPLHKCSLAGHAIVFTNYRKGLSIINSKQLEITCTDIQHAHHVRGFDPLLHATIYQMLAGWPNTWDLYSMRTCIWCMLLWIRL